MQGLSDCRAFWDEKRYTGEIVIDILKYHGVIDAVNASLNAGNTVEIKPELSGIVVAEHIRLFKGKFKNGESAGNDEA